MKNFNSVGWNIAKNGLASAKISTVAILTTVAVTGTVVVTNILNSDEKKIVTKTEVVKSHSSFDYDNLIFSSVLSDIIKPDYNILDKGVSMDIVEEKMVVSSSSSTKTKTKRSTSTKSKRTKVASKMISSKYQFTDEDFDYFEKFGLKRRIKNAEYKGGSTKMQKFIDKNLKYPKSARDKKIEGVVTIHFVVGIQGEILSAEVSKGVHPELDAEALRVVKSFKNWIPKKVNFERVKSKLQIPIRFELQ